MPRRAKVSSAQLNLLDARVPTAPAVPAIREAVKQWHEQGWPGITDTTRTLLNYWFRWDHRLANGRPFAYHESQRDAVETLIYLFEVARVHRHTDLIERFAAAANFRLLRFDDFARYCVKMATGSGKTKVISLVVAWQYFNAVVEGLPDYARSFLLIAPNVIVFERLRTDFAGGRIFRVDPVIPRELQIFWDMQFYLRGDPERTTSQGALYLTNIQQLYVRPDTEDDEPDPITAVLGPRPAPEGATDDDFIARIVARGGPVAVLNDEAHHTHDEDSSWNATIRRLHAGLAGTGDGNGRAVWRGLNLQLDFTATPRHSKGALFSWTVFDYPLKQAMIDGIVKRPIKGITSGISERPSDIASERFRAYLTAGVERWREYREQLAPLGKKPILFVMLNSTDEADDVGDWLRVQYPAEFGGDKLLIIHTDRSGEVSKKDVDKARAVAHDVDLEASPVNCIVSVLMLREGWDVQNVTVIVGLRPYTSKANILPEQTIGRGLRLMFRDQGIGYRERVDVVGNKAFIEFIEQLEREEDVQLETFQVGRDKLHIVTIAPDPAKADKDIGLPRLTPFLARKKTLAEEIAALDVIAFDCPVLPRKKGDESETRFRYEGYDFITLEREIQRDYTIPTPQTSAEVIGYYARRIAVEVKLPSQFAVLVPQVRRFLGQKAFGGNVDLDDPAIIQAMSTNVAQYVCVKTFAKALRTLVIEELVPQLVTPARMLSETAPFPWSRPTCEARRTVFNLAACENEFERAFARFLEAAPDVERFAKLPSLFGFSIEYTDAAGNLRYYEPDFVAVSGAGEHFLIETKGREDIDVAGKDRAARIWCENATHLTDTHWSYIKVPQAEYSRLQPTCIADLFVFQ